MPRCRKVMHHQNPVFTVQIADMAADIAAAQRLRYQVFVQELGGDGPLVDHKAGLERDRFDAYAIHLILRDTQRAADDQVVGTYRLITQAAAQMIGQFYCEDEYDLTPLKNSGKRLLELGRSCLHPDYRGGAAMVHLWSALADYVNRKRIEVMFGVASFHGTDTNALAGPLSLLHHRHLAPPDLRVTARGDGAYTMDQMPLDAVDRVAAMRNTPALIKAYLRLGGTVGAGAFIDHAFNTVDVCLILSTDAIGALQRSIYTKGAGLG